MMALRMKSLSLSVLTLLSLLIPRIVLGDATAIDWGTQSNHLKLSPGKFLTVACPANGKISSRLWGTDIYTDDSSICTAAVHAGLIQAASGGTVQVEGLAGQPGYRGSQRNGVGSRDYGGWTGSFALKPAGSPPPPPPAQSAQVDASPQQAAASSNIQVTYQGAPGNARDWIGIFAVGAGERNWVTWQYTNGNRQGAMTFKAPDNKPGSYEFRMYENDGYKLLATSRPIKVSSTTRPPGDEMSCESTGSGDDRGVHWVWYLLTSTSKGVRECHMGHHTFCAMGSFQQGTAKSLCLVGQHFGDWILKAVVESEPNGTHKCSAVCMDIRGFGIE